MQYVILIYGDEGRFAQMSDPARQQEMYAAYSKYSSDMAQAGVLRSGAELKPTSTATTIRSRGGKVAMTDGPFAETKEQLGGYYVIDVANLDDALHWAGRCPGALTGSIEVRPTGHTAGG